MWKASFVLPVALLTLASLAQAQVIGGGGGGGQGFQGGIQGDANVQGDANSNQQNSGGNLKAGANAQGQIQEPSGTLPPVQGGVNAGTNLQGQTGNQPNAGGRVNAGANVQGQTGNQQGLRGGANVDANVQGQTGNQGVQGNTNLRGNVQGNLPNADGRMNGGANIQGQLRSNQSAPPNMNSRGNATFDAGGNADPRFRFHNNNWYYTYPDGGQAVWNNGAWIRADANGQFLAPNGQVIPGFTGSAGIDTSGPTTTYFRGDASGYASPNFYRPYRRPMVRLFFPRARY